MDMRNTVALIAGLLSCGSAIPYILDIVKGKTHPNVVTWFTWTLLTAIGAAAAASHHEIQTTILLIANSIATATIMVLGLKYGQRKYTAFDITCQVLALLAIVLWRVTHNPSTATALSIAADFLAAMPTINHAWRAPEAETWQTFGLGALPALITIAALSRFDFISLAFPIYLALNNSTIMAIILVRRRALL